MRRSSASRWKGQPRCRAARTYSRPGLILLPRTRIVGRTPGIRGPGAASTMWPSRPPIDALVRVERCSWFGLKPRGCFGRVVTTWRTRSSTFRKLKATALVSMCGRSRSRAKTGSLRSRPRPTVRRRRFSSHARKSRCRGRSVSGLICTGRIRFGRRRGCLRRLGRWSGVSVGSVGVRGVGGVRGRGRGDCFRMTVRRGRTPSGAGPN